MDREGEQPARLGRYELVESLGRGGMGHVFRARAYAAAGVTKDVCVKRIRSERLGERGAVHRFIAEARLSMGLSHANIVPVFDFGRADDGYFLAMEWVDGADLRTILDDGALPPICAAYVAAAVARALAYAHDPDGAATVHRDVKPANVLVALSGDVKLADFGVAAAVGSKRSVAGTEGYMSPEQRAGAEPTGTADLYSLGVMLREMLGEVPDALSPLLDSLLDGDPGRRASDADEVAEALEAFLASERVGGASSPREILRTRTRRAQRRGAPITDVLGAELSFLRDGHQATFSTRMGPSAATETTPPQEPDRRWLGALGLVVIIAIAIGVGRWSSPSEDGEPEGRPTEAPSSPANEGEADPQAPSDPTNEDDDTSPSFPVTVVPEKAPPSARPRTQLPRRASTRAEMSSPPAEEGTLELNAVPWAHVYVDGRRVGETPLLGLRLPAGRHALRLVNEPMGVTREMNVTIRPNEPLRLVVRLDE